MTESMIESDEQRSMNGMEWTTKVGIAGLAGLLALTGCERGSQAPPAPPPPKVKVAEVVEATVPIVLTFSGTIQAIRSVSIVPRVDGYIDERYFVEGTRVKKDDPLYLIDPKPYEATLASYKAQLQRDKANHEYWKEQVTRNEKLVKSGAASQEELENAIANEKESSAAIDNDRANIRKAELDLGYTSITAPFEGRIENTLVNVGALVNAHQTELTTLVQIDPIYTVFNISRAQVEDIQALMREGVVSPGPLTRFEAEVILPDGSAYTKRGKMNFVSAQIDPSTDQMLARAVFPNVYERPSDVRLIPGQYAPVKVYVGERPGSLLVPKAAVIESQVGTQVYVVDGDGKVASRRVVPGPGFQGKRVIKSGLKKGERVVVEGTQKVRDGIRVQASPYEPPKRG